MTRTAIVTDSSACLPRSAPDWPAVRVVPIALHLGSGDVRLDPTVAASEIYRALERDEPVKSSAPTALEYLAAVEETDADEIAIVTPAAEFTVMHRNARLAAELAAPRRVAVLDSRTAAAAHGLVVLEASERAAEGASLEEVLEVAADASRRAELVAALDRLDFLRRSGRVPSVQLGLAEHLGVRPVFRLVGGAVERVGLARSPSAALRRVHREARGRNLDGATRVAVFHADRAERAEELRRLIGRDASVSEFSPSMGIHTGPGVVGVAWLRSPSA